MSVDGRISRLGLREILMSLRFGLKNASCVVSSSCFARLAAEVALRG